MLMKSPVFEPSLTNLAFVLRHKELWPENFVWDFRYCETCAIGLCRQIYGKDPRDLDPRLENAETFWSGSSYRDIFGSYNEPLRIWDIPVWPYSEAVITPEHVAARIDRWVAAH